MTRYWEVVIEAKQGSNDMLNVIHYQSSGTADPDFQDMADQIRALINGNIVSRCGTRVTWTGITVREDIEGGVGTYYPFTSGDLAGGVSSADHADMVAMLIRKVTGSLVKPTLGWAKQGGISMGGLTATGAWDQDTIDDVGNLWDALIDFTLTDDITMGMVVKARNPTAPNTQPYTPVTSISVFDRPRSQNSRVAGRGS